MVDKAYDAYDLREKLKDNETKAGEYDRLWKILGKFFSDRGFEFDGEKGVDIEMLLAFAEQRIAKLVADDHTAKHEIERRRLIQNEKWAEDRWQTTRREADDLKCKVTKLTRDCVNLEDEVTSLKDSVKNCKNAVALVKMERDSYRDTVNEQAVYTRKLERDETNLLKNNTELVLLSNVRAEEIGRLLQYREADRSQIDLAQRTVYELHKEIKRLTVLNEKFRESNIHYKDNIDRLLVERNRAETRVKELENALDLLKTSYLDQEHKNNALEAKVQELTLRNQVLEARENKPTITSELFDKATMRQEFKRMLAKVRRAEDRLGMLKDILQGHAPSTMSLEGQIAHIIREKDQANSTVYELQHKLAMKRGTRDIDDPWTISLIKELVDIIRNEASKKSPKWEHAAFGIWERLSE